MTPRVLVIAALSLLASACYGDVPWPETGEPVEDEAEAEAPSFVDEAWPEDEVQPHVIVMDRMIFAREEPLGVAPGFDIDGITSDGSDAEGCFWSDLESPGGVPGIDNQFATLVPALELAGGGVVEDFVQSAINDGSILITVLLHDAEDLQDDPDVTITMTSSLGKPLIGTHGYMLPHQTFDLDLEAPSATFPGKIVDGVVTAGPFDGFLPVVVFNVEYVLDFRESYLHMELNEAGGLDHGLFGGGITIESVVALLEKTGDKDIIELFAPIVPNAADLAPQPDGSCTRLSAAVEVMGVPSFLYEYP